MAGGVIVGGGGGAGVGIHKALVLHFGNKIWAFIDFLMA